MAHTLIIAEAGVNHNGSIGLAKQLIDIAVEAGADIVKFQTWVTEELVSKDAPKAKYQISNDGDSSQYEMLKKLELTFSDFKELKRYSESKGIKFLSTPDDNLSLDFLVDDLNLDIIKVGSGEVTNIPFLKRIGQKKRPVILSTGMAYLGEVEKALFTLLEYGAPEVSLLHCTSNYPADFSTVNLVAMDTMRRAFKIPVGYSDHTEGTEVSVAAAALGASIIEKHFTIDKNLPGPDHKASLSPEELKKLVQEIRNVERACAGDGRKIPNPVELETKLVVQKGVYAKRNLNKGEQLKEEDLVFKRPKNNGILISDVERVVGKVLNQDISKGNTIHYNQFE